MLRLLTPAKESTLVEESPECIMCVSPNVRPLTPAKEDSSYAGPYASSCAPDDTVTRSDASAAAANTSHAKPQQLHPHRTSSPPPSKGGLRWSFLD